MSSSGEKAAERQKICSPWRKPWDQGNMKTGAPEGRNNIIAISSVPPLRGGLANNSFTHGSRRGLHIFRRAAADLRRPDRCD
jgi:hypothetical protein